jgi:tape measure domain-containing protein
MAVAGDIRVVMTLDDKEFSYKVQNSGKLIRELTQTIRSSATSVKNLEDRYTGLGASFSSLIRTGGMLRFFLYDIRDVFGATAGKVIEASAQIEKMTLLMKGLSKATTEQGKALDAIQGREFVFKMAKNAPFEVNALTDAFVKMKSAGLDPMDGKLQTLVDSVAKFGGSSELLKRSSVAIQQMSGKGVISMEELRQQLGEAIPTAMQDMADGAGLSMAELVRHISKGEVESTTALERMFFVMRVRNGDSAKAFADTWLGQLEKLKTNFTLFGNQVGEGGFYKGVTESLRNLNVFLQSDSGKKFASDIGQALVSTMEAVQAAISFVIRYSEEIKSIGKGLLIIWGSSVIYNGIKGLTLALGVYTQRATAALASERTIQASRIMLDRQALVSRNQANVAALAAERAISLARVELYAQASAAEMAIALRRNQARLAAERSLQTGFTTRGTPVDVARATATMNSQRALALAAQQNARQFAISQAQMAAAANASSAAIVAANQRTAVSLTAMGTAARAGAVAMGVASRGIAFLGGPLGILAIALTAGAVLWDAWGSKAKKAISGAEDALAALKGGYASFENVQQLKIGIEADKERVKTLSYELATLVKIADAKKETKPNYKIRETSAELSEISARLEKNQNALSKAEAQAISNSAKDYVTQETRATEIKIDAIEVNARSLLGKETELIRKNAKNKEEAAIEVRKATIESAKKTADIAIKIYTDQNKAIEKTLASGVDSKNKPLQARAINDYNALLDANRKLINEQEDFKKQAQEAYDGLVFQPKADPNANGNGSTVNKIKEFTDNLKAENAKLSETIKDTNDVFGELAKFNTDLENGEYNKTVKVGKKKTKVKPTAQEIDAARAEIINQGMLKDIQDAKAFVERTANEAGQAFDSLTTAWIEGNEKYKAALDNYNSDTNAASSADAKMLAGIEEKRQALQRYLDSSAQSAENAAVAMKLFNDTANETVNNTRGAKALEMAQGFKKQAEQLEISMIENATERARAEGEIRLRNLKENYDAQMLLQANHEQAKQKLTDDYNRLRAATERDVARQSETPMEQLSRKWQDVTTQMQEASVNWANASVDAFVEFTKTGKLNFSSLVDSILTDILRITMQKQLAAVVKTGVDELTKIVGGMFGETKAPEVADESGTTQSQSLLAKGMEYLTGIFKGTSDEAEVLTDSLGQSAIEGIAQAATSSTAAGALTYVANAANAAAVALNQIAVNGGGASGGGGGGGGFLDGILDFFGGGSGYEELPDFVPSYSDFANGGIMTSMGAMKLRKYASGGIAKSPQLALFGEGSMNEAYVPLPDGRTIPVSMRGGNSGASNVTVNVINAPAGTETRESQNPDGSTNVDVIIAQVEGKISQNLAKGRGSLSSVMEKTYGLNRAMGSYR